MSDPEVINISSSDDSVAKDTKKNDKTRNIKRKKKRKVVKPIEPCNQSSEDECENEPPPPNSQKRKRNLSATKKRVEETPSTSSTRRSTRRRSTDINYSDTPQKKKLEKSGSCTECPQCLQPYDNVINFKPVGQSERVTLQNADLKIEGSDRQEYRLNNFTLYCSKNHLISLSSERFRGKNMKNSFFFTGEVSQILADKDLSSGVMTVSTKITQHNVDQKYFAITVTTMVDGEEQDYHLGMPSQEYSYFFNEYERMAWLSFVVTNRLDQAFDESQNVSYDDLVEYLEGLDQIDGKATEFQADEVNSSARYLAEELISLEDVDVDDDDVLSYRNIEAAVEILQRGGFNDGFPQKRESGPRGTRRRAERGDDVEPPDVEDEDGPRRSNVLSTYTTPLVRKLFSAVFNLGETKEMSSSNSDNKGIRSSVPDTSDSPKIIRKIKEEKFELEQKYSEIVILFGTSERFILRPGTYVRLEGDADSEYNTHYYGQIIDMAEDQVDPDSDEEEDEDKENDNDNDEGIVLHIQLLLADNTVINTNRNPREFFKSKDCTYALLSSLVGVLQIEHRPVVDVEAWRNSDSTEKAEEKEEAGFYWKFYHCTQSGRFFYPPESEVKPTCFCAVPAPLSDRTRVLYEDNFVVGAETFQRDDFVYIQDIVSSKLGLEHHYHPDVVHAVGQYRSKPFDFKGLKDAWNPYIVARITAIDFENGEIALQLLYRPENCLSYEESRCEPYTKLYVNTDRSVHVAWTQISAQLVATCRPVVVYGSQDAVVAWTFQDPNRFYVHQTFSKRKGFSDISAEEAAKLKIPLFKDMMPEKTLELTPLRTLDIFAGAGGLSSGLEESGSVRVKWAVEVDRAAVKAFEQNHSEAKVFNMDCNQFLEMVVENPREAEKRCMPRKGEVDCIVGGPPCQGFTDLLTNEAKKTEGTKMKNSQVANYVGFIDHYRPRFLLLENVRNMMIQWGLVLEHIIAALVEIGYQTSVAVLQAGHYGVAQTRRRLIIVAAAPGETLPAQPTPWHVFPDSMNEDVIFNKHKYWYETVCGAPRRVVTAWDILADLPSLKEGKKEASMKYQPQNPCPIAQHYHRVGAGDKLIDHVSKTLGSRDQARVNLVPTKAGSDWRDIPNKEIEIGNGEVLKELKYTTIIEKIDPKTKERITLKGVCTCLNWKGKPKKKCQDKWLNQKFTIIPWWIVHSVHRKSGSWAGIYGRIPYGGIFRTTLTSPIPSGKQGQVLHPVENRVCSVREFARSQGFRDNFRFSGSLEEKYRQVGNAVPPPLGKAIGLEIRKALIMKTTN